MAMEDLVTQIANTLEKDGRVQAVFGEALKLEHHTIVPVAVVSGGGGAGGAQGTVGTGFSGGAGLGLQVRPVGFIHEQGTDVVFTPIHLDVRNQPLWTEAAVGVRKAIDLVGGLVAQFMQRRAAAKPVEVVVPPPQNVIDEEVTAPS